MRTTICVPKPTYIGSYYTTREGAKKRAKQENYVYWKSDIRPRRFHFTILEQPDGRWRVARYTGAEWALINEIAKPLAHAFSVDGEDGHFRLQQLALKTAEQSRTVCATCGSLNVIDGNCPDCHSYGTKLIATTAEIAACQNCNWWGDASHLNLDIPDYDERVEPGEEEPAGECPICRCLAHTVEA